MRGRVVHFEEDARAPVWQHPLPHRSVFGY
jgi:hypothetical protein